MRRLKILLIFTFLLFPSGSALAQTVDLNLLAQAGFNPNFIISDSEMADSQAMSLEEIKTFLESKPGILDNYEVLTPLGMNKSAAEIIYEASHAYQINPRVLLVMLQKEQSLIENPSPTPYNFDWAAGYARCDACAPTDPNVARFKGFATQVDNAAAALRYYLDNPDNKNWLKRSGLVYSIDSVPVIPANLATAGLYNYTPHLAGNFNFWQIWQRWFSFDTFLPDGAIVKTDDDAQIWLIREGKRYPLSPVAFYSRFKPQSILLVDNEILKQYETRPLIKYPNYSLLKDPAGQLYLLAGFEKRPMTKEAFRYFGFNPEEVIAAKTDDLTPFSNGEPLAKDKKYPLGVLMQDQKTKEIFYVVDSVKHLVLDKGILKINFDNKKPLRAASNALNKFSLGEPVKFNDGVLLQTADSSAVYLIADGKRHWVKDDATFEKLGFSWDNVINVSPTVLELQAEGDPIFIPSFAIAIK